MVCVCVGGGGGVGGGRRGGEDVFRAVCVCAIVQLPSHRHRRSNSHQLATRIRAVSYSRRKLGGRNDSTLCFALDISNSVRPYTIYS